MQKMYIFIAIVLWIFSTSINSQENKKTKTLRKKTYRTEALSIRDCIIRSLKYNLDIEVESYNPKIKEVDVTIAHSAFDPVLSASFSYGKSESVSTSIYSSDSTTTSASFKSQLAKKNILGGNIAFVYQVSYSNQDSSVSVTRFNPVWTHGFSLQVTQPLLKGLGIDYNRSSIELAKIAVNNSYYTYYNKVLSVIKSVQDAYWDLVNARKNYELQYKSLELAENLYNITQERIKVGSLAAAEILNTERNVATKQDSLVVAEQNVYAAEDKLKQLIRPLDISYYKDVRLLPTQRPVFKEIRVNFQKSLVYALRNRADIQQSKLGLQSASITIMQRKNQLLPSLDFTASLGYSGIGDGSSDAWDPAKDLEHPEWSVGLSLEVPLGNRSAKGYYKKALLQRKQLVVQHRNLESAVILEIRQAIRDLTTAIRRVKTARKTRELAEKQLLNEENKFRAGLIALYQVQDTEENLTEARISEANALISYQKAIVALDKAKGALETNLARYNIHFDLLNPHKNNIKK